MTLGVDMKLFFAGLILLIFCAPCVGQQSSVVVISCVTRTLGSMSVGINIGLVNVATGDYYFSKPLSTFWSKHSFLEIPEGEYRVFYFHGVPVLQTADPNAQEFFGAFNIENGKCYYLGNFLGRWSNHQKGTTFRIKDNSIPPRLIKILIKRRLVDRKENMVKLYPFLKDSLMLD